jgi:hypothetical protein
MSDFKPEMMTRLRLPTDTARTTKNMSSRIGKYPAVSELLGRCGKIPIVRRILYIESEKRDLRVQNAFIAIQVTAVGQANDA